jgi:hypothetical protein
VRVAQRQAPPRVQPGSVSLTDRPEPLANRSNPFWLPFVVGVPVTGSIGLYLVCHYLSSRFDAGSPMTHDVDPHLAIWISLLAVLATIAIWVVAMLEQRNRDRSWSGLSRGTRPRDRARPVARRGVR